MNILKSKFAPCPKCGGAPVVDSHSQSYYGDERYVVRCIHCGLELIYSSTYDYPFVSITWHYHETDPHTSVVDAWNKASSIPYDIQELDI